MKRPRPRPPASSEIAYEAELEVQTVGAHGDGVAVGPGGARVFIPLTLAGERVSADVAGDRARLRELHRCSPERVSPPCPHFGPCGGCALQHWSHAPYLAWKVEQIRAALARERLETEFATPYAAPPGSRRRLALHARKAGSGAAVGYKPRRSWDFIAIDVCPIADARLVDWLPALRRLAGPLFEHPRSAPILHLTWTETGLDVDVTGVEAKSGGLSADARRRVADAAKLHDIARVTLSGELLYQGRQPLVQFGQATVPLPPGSFLQAVTGAEAAMASFACDAVADARRVADLFCGAGAFSFRLAERAQVLALDAAPLAIRALQAGRASAPGLKAITAESRDLERRPLLAEEMNRLDAVIFDPPRAGALEQARQIARSRVSRAVGVSCNPATFARDARVLADNGFSLRRVLPVDQFLWSPHIELVGVFER